MWIVGLFQVNHTSYEYFKTTIKKAFPGKSDDEVAEAILACRKALAPSEGRAKLTECVNKRLR